MAARSESKAAPAGHYFTAATLRVQHSSLQASSSLTATAQGRKLAHLLPLVQSLTIRAFENRAVLCMIRQILDLQPLVTHIQQFTLLYMPSAEGRFCLQITLP